MIGQVLALVGALIVLIAAIGVVRLGDVFSRMHALTKGSMLGLLLLFAGAAVNVGSIEAVTTLILAGVLHVVTLPPGSNLVSRAVYRAGPAAGDVDAKGDDPVGS